MMKRVRPVFRWFALVIGIIASGFLAACIMALFIDWVSPKFAGLSVALACLFWIGLWIAGFLGFKRRSREA